MPFEKQIHRLLYVVRQRKHVKDKHSRKLWAAFHSVEDQKAHEVSVKSESYRFELFWLSCSLLVWFLVCLVDLRVHAVHALRPLSIDHSLLLLTNSQTKTPNSVQKKAAATQSFATSVLLPFVLDMTFYFVQLFPKHATRFEVQHTFISSADELKVKEICQPKITVVTTLNYS